ncbi:hypothetical protein [Aquimarina aggregata]|uniref:hypothetical protein n=1 Tax=Aquimarina aggregata TaxID=1642818 RepID=UPI0024938643|nr:hypothetical protein [Aquimarina aggregata]
MIDDKTKKQAREIVDRINDSKKGEEQQHITVSKSTLDAMPDDARALWDAAWEKELLRREGTLEENERKYQAAKMILSINDKGEEERRIIVSTFYWEDGVLNIKMNAFGYDRLPPDVQEAFGEREDVVEKWIKPNDHAIQLKKAFVTYSHHDNEGHDSWEEYRDAKGLGPTEEVSIPKAQDVDSNDKPRETPTVDQDTESLITK